MNALMNRFTQLIVRAITFLLVALFTKFGADMSNSSHAASIAQIAQTMGTGLAALGAFSLDLFMHSKLYARIANFIITEAEPGAPGSSNAMVNDGSKPASNPGLKSAVILIAFALLGISIAFGMSGCSSQEKNQIGQSYQTIQTTSEQMDSALKLGSISPAHAYTLLPYIQKAQDAVDAWDNAFIAGSNTKAALMQAALQALSDLATQYAAAKLATALDKLPPPAPETATATH